MSIASSAGDFSATVRPGSGVKSATRSPVSMKNEWTWLLNRPVQATAGAPSEWMARVG